MWAPEGRSAHQDNWFRNQVMNYGWQLMYQIELRIKSVKCDWSVMLPLCYSIRLVFCTMCTYYCYVVINSMSWAFYLKVSLFSGRLGFWYKLQLALLFRKTAHGVWEKTGHPKYSSKSAFSCVAVTLYKGLVTWGRLHATRCSLHKFHRQYRYVLNSHGCLQSLCGEF